MAGSLSTLNKTAELCVVELPCSPGVSFQNIAKHYKRMSMLNVSSQCIFVKYYNNVCECVSVCLTYHHEDLSHHR